MSCEAASWIPDAVTATLHCGRSAEPVIAWLSLIRATIDEYEPLITVRPQSTVSEQSTDTSSTTPDSAFDEILSQLGKEIYKLDEYQKNLTPDEREVSLSILNLFDECLDVINEDEARTQQNKETNDIYATNDIVAAADSVVNGAGDNSEGESSVSEASFVTSTPNGRVRVTDSDTDIAPEVKPVVPARARLKTPPPPHYVDMDMKTNAAVPALTPKRLGSVSDSESTCWSYKECSSETEDECNRQKYAAVWSHSSGYHNSDDILREVISKQYATVSRLSFDTTCDLPPSEFSVYTLREVGDRCAGDVSAPSAAPVAAMTPAGPTADDTGGYEPVCDAITTDENIYEEIDYCNGNSYTDEGCSCGGSIEVESCSMSACSEGIGRDSPLYANLRDPDAYTIPADVIYWTKLLLDPFCNEDEDEEWITPEECSEYSREQRPPFVIPRIRYREPRRELRSQQRLYTEDSILESVPSGRQYERPDYGSVGDRNRQIDIRSIKSGADNYGRLDKRLGNSTENLLTARRPNHLQIPASSSGDSLNVELRDREPESVRSRKVRSMVAPKTKKSPVPAPRMVIPPPAEASVVLEGPIKRTKFTEGGKKTKKNWTDCYMVLTTTALIFYKDKKTFDASNIPKPLGTPPSPTAPRAEIVLALQNAHVVQCIQTHTRRYTRSLMLTVDYDQYLLQDETEEGAKRLLKHIQNIIYKLGPPALDEMRESVNHYQSSNTDLESLGRTPPVSRHINKAKQKAGGSSNEDLSDSTEKVKSKLRKFLHKRPSKEILYKKGILRDEPIFGRNLADVCPGSSPLVPNFVVACVREIESSEENMCTDGLYRASGNLSQVQKIRLEVDQNNLKVLEENTDIHVLTGSLKLFFRELKEPLIPWSMFDRVLNACSIRPREVRLKEFRDIIHSLPQCNRETLKYLLEHLLRVTEYSDRNRMHTANLAIVFGPTLLWAPPEQSHRIAFDCIQQNNVVEILLNDFEEIFRK